MINKKFKVYLVTDLTNDMKYVGITLQSLNQRWSQHCNKPQPNRLYPAIQSHGKNNFKIEVIFYADSIDNMIEMEDFYIKKHNTLHPNGYNLREGGKYGKFSEEVKERMTRKLKSRWKNNPEIYANFLKERENYVENKKEPIIGIEINNASVIRFSSISESKSNGLSPSSNLTRESKHDHNYIWFYDDGFSDQFYIDLAEIQLGGFGKYKKNAPFWSNPEHKKERISLMIDAAKSRAKSLIAVNIKDGSVVEFPSINDALKKGYKWGNIRQSLKGICSHAYGYKWSYKN